MRPNSSNSGLRSCSSKPRGICPTKSLMASWSFMGTAGPGFSPLMLTPLSAVLKPRRGPGPTGGADPPGAAAAISPPRPPSPQSHRSGRSCCPLPGPVARARRKGAGPGGEGWGLHRGRGPWWRGVQRVGRTRKGRGRGRGRPGRSRRDTGVWLEVPAPRSLGSLPRFLPSSPRAEP